MTDIIALIITVAILALAIGYIVKAKRAGVKCIGCPSSGCNCNSGCNSLEERKCNCSDKIMQ